MSCDVFIQFDLIAPDEDTLKRALEWQKAQAVTWNKWSLKGKSKKKKKEYVQTVEVEAIEDETHTPLTGEQGTLALMIEQNPDCHIKGSCWRGEDAQYSEALHFPKKTWDAANGEWI